MPDGALTFHLASANPADYRPEWDTGAPGYPLERLPEAMHSFEHDHIGGVILTCLP